MKELEYKVLIGLSERPWKAEFIVSIMISLENNFRIFEFNII